MQEMFRLNGSDHFQVVLDPPMFYFSKSMPCKCFFQISKIPFIGHYINLCQNYYKRKIQNLVDKFIKQIVIVSAIENWKTTTG